MEKKLCLSLLGKLWNLQTPERSLGTRGALRSVGERDGGAVAAVSGRTDAEHTLLCEQVAERSQSHAEREPVSGHTG